MEDLQSFNIKINQAVVALPGTGGLRTWGTPGQYFFSLSLTPSNLSSTYNLTGFKSTNIYGVSVSGTVVGNFANATKCADVEDWSFSIALNGTPPLISGAKVTGTDGFGLFVRGNTLNSMTLSKNTNCISFANPFTSVSSITFQSLQVSGKGAEFLNEVALFYDLYFTFYYRYEGE